MSAATRLTRAACLLLTLAAAACAPRSEPAGDVEAAEAAEEVAPEAAAAAAAEAATPEGSGAEAADPEADKPEATAPPQSAAGAGPLPLRATRFLDVSDRVAHALYRARVIAVNHALHRVTPHDAEAHAGADGLTRFSIALSSNTQGNLIECACRRGQLGGLARRAALLDTWRARDEGPLFVVDAGNALVTDPVPAPLDGPEALAAEALLDAYTMMGVDVLAVGARDVAFGAQQLEAWASAAGLPLVTANWRSADGALGQTWKVVERDGVRLGFTALGPDVGATSDFFMRSGVQVREAGALNEALQAIESAGVDFTVLAITGGLAQVQRTLAPLADTGLRPDLVVVSGSRRLMQTPTFIEGVPVVEASDRGRHLVRLDVAWDATDPRFSDPDLDAAGRLREYRILLHTVETTRERLRADPDAPASRQRTYAALLRRQTQQLWHWMDVLAGLGSLQSPSRSTIALELETLTLDMDGREDVQARVEQARAAGWSPDDHDHDHAHGH